MQSAHKKERQAFAPGTYKNLELQWATFVNFCAFYDLQYAPVDEETLVLFLKFLELNLKAPRSVQNYLSGVQTVQHWLGHCTKAFKSLRVRHMLRAIFRTSQHKVKQAQPITPQLLCKIKASLNMCKSEDCTFFVACVVAFMLMLRKSNLVPDTKNGFTASQQLARKHLHFTAGAVWVDIVWSKTLQFRFEVLKYPLLSIPGSELCPVTALANMVRLNQLPPDSPCFAHPDGSPWTYHHFQAKLRATLKACGYKSEKFSSHSFRREGCSFAWQSGVPDFMIQTLGDWKSDIYKSYCHMDIQSRAAACKMFRRHLMSLGL